MQKIIKLEKSIIPSCDVSDLEKLKSLVKETCSVGGIGAYKIGLELALRFGISSIVDAIKKHTNLPIIYDHQKAATDIPDLGEKFAKAVKGVDAVILFPVMGPETEKEWIKACKKEKLGIIVGGEMTHKAFLKSENGFINDTAPLKIYEIAAKHRINDFVVPGNKPEKIKYYKSFLEARGLKPIFYSPGLITQGGSITESAKAAERWHAIVGRALYNAKDINKAAKEMVKALD
ncbi:MAG: orotidine 5'-phosphate decarboxylase [Candidatus Woesearchaeota archaeon]|jgi:orotidine-5'-phosphate decarboxylase|nr:orotidine 5'-phosphate decarboxylase [Candidatus Woesearchaeota archaeon]MDP7623227.1 orotidine 5'-phosphate decarboxylase [Candidatus Woesearchaeota archaeon]HJN56997.1 orotidine 5'-phosphate decarboxylase / HUMPS family protein [Candidatus Woesearchaeota archaeon]|tara:strand:- start:5289 stop:5987 length:699 start_codon:yes stop_codon:yes gene_type:complete